MQKRRNDDGALMGTEFSAMIFRHVNRFYTSFLKSELKHFSVDSLLRPIPRELNGTFVLFLTSLITVNHVAIVKTNCTYT